MTEEPVGATDELDDPWHDEIAERREEFAAPQVLALLAFVLAVASFLGLGLMNGSTYTITLLSQQPTRGQLVLGPLLGALLALLPVTLGWRAAARSLDDDPPWVAPVARTAVVLGLMAVVLRLVVAVLQAAEEPGMGGFTRL